MKQPTSIICLSPYSGGMELDAIKLAKNLSEFIPVTLMVKEDAFIASKKDEYISDTLQLQTIDFRSSLSLKIVFQARKIIQENSIKNVIFFGASELKSLFFSFLGLDINLIVRHGTTKSKPKKDFFHRLIYSGVKYHVSISKHLENNVRYIIPFGQQTQSKLIYPSVNFKEIEPQKHTRLTLLHVGRIAHGKGQIDAIKACEILIKEEIDFQLLLVGGFDEKYKEQFMQFYNSCFYKEHIKLIGFQKNIEKFFSQSDIFLFPSWGEGFGNAFIEALNARLICIAYSNTTFLEFYNMNFSFVLVEDKNIDELQKKLLLSVQNIEILKHKNSENYKLVQKNFLKEIEMKKYLELLK